VREDGSPSRLRDALNAGWRELALYLATGVAYVAVGVAFPEFLFAWIVCMSFLLVCVVVLPDLLDRAKAGR
jgi:hypothetical protein